MKQENSIEVQNICKSFKVFLDKGHTLKELALFSKRRQYQNREVLKGISFEVRKGEAIGLIGHNGCGKSTTLKLLTKIMYPDSGSIEMRGRVSSLIELGAGFHPDMSGRENIYINASIFGLTRKEIDSRLKDIIEFSELQQFIDNPVRTYSSGMYMRLAFAVAINVDADILLIDEILAVGDINFQAKCFNKLREIKGKGTTIVIVSHSMDQIEKICDRSIWIHEGVIKAEGKPRDVHPQYFEYMGKARQALMENENQDSPKDEENETDDKNVNEELVQEEETATDESRWGTGEARITEVKFLNQKGEEASVFKTGEEVRIEIAFQVKKAIKEANFGVGIFRTDGIHCYGTNTQIDKLDKFNLDESGKVVLKLDSLELLPGEYDFDFAIGAENCTDIDYCRSVKRIQVYSEISDVGVARVSHEWNIDI